MTQLPPDKIATKVIKPFYANMVAVLIVGIVTKTPLSENAWLEWLQDPAVAASLIMVLAFAVGYKVEETAL